MFLLLAALLAAATLLAPAGAARTPALPAGARAQMLAKATRAGAKRKSSSSDEEVSGQVSMPSLDASPPKRAAEESLVRLVRASSDVSSRHFAELSSHAVQDTLARHLRAVKSQVQLVGTTRKNAALLHKEALWMHALVARCALELDVHRVMHHVLDDARSRDVPADRVPSARPDAEAGAAPAAVQNSGATASPQNPVPGPSTSGTVPNPKTASDVIAQLTLRLLHRTVREQFSKDLYAQFVATLRSGHTELCKQGGLDPLEAVAARRAFAKAAPSFTGNAAVARVPSAPIVSTIAKEASAISAYLQWKTQKHNDATPSADETTALAMAYVAARIRDIADCPCMAPFSEVRILAGPSDFAVRIGQKSGSARPLIDIGIRGKPPVGFPLPDAKPLPTDLPSGWKDNIAAYYAAIGALRALARLIVAANLGSSKDNSKSSALATWNAFKAAASKDEAIEAVGYYFHEVSEKAKRKAKFAAQDLTAAHTRHAELVGEMETLALTIHSIRDAVLSASRSDKHPPAALHEYLEAVGNAALLSAQIAHTQKSLFFLDATAKRLKIKARVLSYFACIVTPTSIVNETFNYDACKNFDGTFS